MAKERARSTRPLRPADMEGAPDISSLEACIEDARLAALDRDSGPPDPTDYDELRGRLETACSKFPSLYRQEFIEPFIQTIDQLGAADFTRILLTDPGRERLAGLMLDMSQTALQRSDRFQIAALNAFEQVVSDLYDGFLSAENRRGINPPDNRTTAPLAKWGRPDMGPYTWPVDATENFGAHAAVVSLPPANARKGLLAWSALGHETAGHDVLHADNGLQNQLAGAVWKALAHMDGALGEYWSSRIDETSSDLMGILNMGPAAGIGLVGYFRGLNKASTGKATLSNDGPSDEGHPADIVRGFLAAETVVLLSFSQSAAWSKLIADETAKDVGEITLADRPTSVDEARESARLVADAIANSKADALEGHALSEIQTWQDKDETIVREVRRALVTTGSIPDLGQGRVFAAHVVAAAIIEGLANGPDLPIVFDRMIAILAEMKDKNPSWGPLFVRHPGDIRRDRAYVPHM